MSLLPNLDQMTDNEKLAVLESIQKSIAQSKEIQKKKIGENVDLVVQALKKIESDIRDRFDSVGNSIEKRVLSIKDGRDGSDGKDGRDGKDGKSGKDGLKGDKGDAGQDGTNGIDGVDGVSVVNANIDFDGSLIITLSNGRVINVGEVVSPDIAEKIKVISTMSTNGAVGIKDEGSSISTGVKNINFVGASVTATNSGDDVTVNVSSGTGTVTSVAFSGGTTGLTVTGSPITTTGTITLAGTLAVANGGTGTATPAIVAGTNITVSGTWPNQTINSSGSSGTVTSASVVSANGFAGTVATATTTPAITISTSITGVLKGNGTAISAATAGTDYVAPSGALGTPSSGTATNLTGLPLSTGVTGTLPVANGGTGLTTLTANNVILGNGTSTPSFVAPSTSGNVLTSNGTTWASTAPAAGGITYTTTKTANYTAVANDGVLTNTTAGAFTVTLPASPSNGAQVIVADAAGTWGTNNLTVGRNGNNIADLAQDLVCDISGTSVQFVYNSSGTASWEVYAQVGGNGGTAVTLDGVQTLTNKTINAANNTIIGIGSSVVRSARTSNTILAAADNSTLIDITSGTFSQTFTAAATLGSGWFVYLRNSGTGDITLDPNASELIDGLTSYIMYPSEVRLVQCTGTAFTSVVLSPFYRQFNATATFTNPPGYAALSVKCIGGGGGGGSGRRGAAATGRGGGAPGGAPATLMRTVGGIAAGTAITITVGAGGSGGAAQATDSTNGVAGTAGGNTTFGSTYGITAFGGAGGIGGTAANASPRTSGSGSAGVGTSAVAVSNGGMPFADSAYGSTVSGFQNNIDEGGGAGNVGCSMWGGAAGAGCNNDVGGGAGSSLRGVSGASGGGAIFNNDSYAQPEAAGARGSYAIGGGAAAGVSADTPTAGTAGATGDDYIPGAGGSGGGSSKTTNAAAGGAGGSPGGGGGGGGASLNATGTSGAGGSGAAGRCIVSGAA